MLCLPYPVVRILSSTFLMLSFLLCWIWGFHSTGYEEYRLLNCSVMLSRAHYVTELQLLFLGSKCKQSWTFFLFLPMSCLSYSLNQKTDVTFFSKISASIQTVWHYSSGDWFIRFPFSSVFRTCIILSSFIVKTYPYHIILLFISFPKHLSLSFMWNFLLYYHHSGCTLLPVQNNSFQVDSRKRWDFS